MCFWRRCTSFQLKLVTSSINLWFSQPDIATATVAKLLQYRCRFIFCRSCSCAKGNFLDTECFRYLDNLNIICWFGFIIVPVFAYAKPGPKKHCSLLKLTSKNHLLLVTATYQNGVQILDTLDSFRFLFIYAHLRPRKMYLTSIILTSNVQFKYRAILSHLKRYVKKVKFENDVVANDLSDAT